MVFFDRSHNVLLNFLEGCWGLGSGCSDWKACLTCVHDVLNGWRGWDMLVYVFVKLKVGVFFPCCGRMDTFCCFLNCVGLG